LNYGRE